MSVTYGKVVAEVALRVGALKTEQSFVQEGLYTTAPLTLAEIDSDSPYSLSAIQDAVLSAEERLVQAIANVGQHPWRTSLISLSASIASGSNLPAVDASSVPIVGVYGAVIDASDSIVCSEQSVDDVRRAIRTDTNRRVPIYWYAIDDTRIIHTRTNVKVTCCVYSRSAQASAITSNSGILLPDALDEAYVCGAASYLLPETEKGTYRQYFEMTLVTIAKGLTIAPATTKEAA